MISTNQSSVFVWIWTNESALPDWLCCRDKWKEEERVVFESEEEAIIAQNILEEMLGHELGCKLSKGEYELWTGITHF